jgi:hypothetical protein
VLATSDARAPGRERAGRPSRRVEEFSNRNHLQYTAGCAVRVRGGLLSSLGGFVIRIRILMYRDVSCVYPVGYMYP